ncbi:hypothetical protein IWW57_002703 [Coemansia sp. S610]|nr:hypothetical protein LPJ60_004766 [Coemansia sp. RSA 2675]KAJ2027219.1 hypothetical protein IWW57_002703 [Coemansia sp. S610]KAJ2414088.1 hypothetical protein GGI10_002618 [Coemansia sp. RSA 2530]KAJ2697231.1 hypothetical protein H4218_004089 [Coemansia sp. IMI 209128]
MSPKYTFLVAALALAHTSVANMAEVGYAPQTLVAAQQYMVNRPNPARMDEIYGHGHGHGNGRAGLEPEGDESEGGHFRDLEESDSESSSSEVKDNSATNSGYSALTALFAAGSMWAAVF